MEALWQDNSAPDSLSHGKGGAAPLSCWLQIGPVQGTFSLAHNGLLNHAYVLSGTFYFEREHLTLEHLNLN